MTRKRAMEYDVELKKQLEDGARERNENETMGKYIVDNFVEFLPDDDVKGMVFLSNTPASYKASNARLDLKKALVAGVEFVASINSPQSIFNYIQLLLVSALFIGNAIKQPLNKKEAYMVYWLHTKGAYQSGVGGNRFIHEFKKWYQQKEEKELKCDEIEKLINHLYDIKVLDFNNGEIYLKETVVGKLE